MTSDRSAFDELDSKTRKALLREIHRSVTVMHRTPVDLRMLAEAYAHVVCPGHLVPGCSGFPQDGEN